MSQLLLKDGVKPSHVAIIGAGPVGALLALYLARRGWQVDLYDQRADIRLPENKVHAGGRSINLALSERGVVALRESGLGLDEVIFKDGVPMRGRMIHLEDGTLESQPYSMDQKHILSINRGQLNLLLVEELSAFPNVNLHFNHRLRSCNLETCAMEFEIINRAPPASPANELAKAQLKSLEIKKKEAKLVIGCDGAYSSVRVALNRKIRMNYSQEYIAHKYCELTIPAIVKEGGETEFAMDPNHLHIWPKLTFMLIALPNQDKTFTCTIFMPETMFQAIQSNEDLDRFFDENFPDAVRLIGRRRLHEEYFMNPKGSLFTVKCQPYHYEDKCLIMGDAAHAMVPFFGQGLNCGFQDISVLIKHLDEHASLSSALRAYSEYRHPDVTTACDLALYNYIEMRANVRSLPHKLKRKVELLLYRYGVLGVMPLYEMVTFTSMRYSEVNRKWKRQDRAIRLLLWGVGLGAVGLLLYWLNKSSFSLRLTASKKEAITAAATVAATERTVLVETQGVKVEVPSSWKESLKWFKQESKAIWQRFF